MSWPDRKRRCGQPGGLSTHFRALLQPTYFCGSIRRSQWRQVLVGLCVVTARPDACRVSSPSVRKSPAGQSLTGHTRFLFKRGHFKVHTQVLSGSPAQNRCARPADQPLPCLHLRFGGHRGTCLGHDTVYGWDRSDAGHAAGTTLGGDRSQGAWRSAKVRRGGGTRLGVGPHYRQHPCCADLHIVWGAQLAHRICRQAPARDRPLRQLSPCQLIDCKLRKPLGLASLVGSRCGSGQQ